MRNKSKRGHLIRKVIWLSRVFWFSTQPGCAQEYSRVNPTRLCTRVQQGQPNQAVHNSTAGSTEPGCAQQYSRVNPTMLCTTVQQGHSMSSGPISGNFTISDFDEILPVASTTFQTRFCKVSASDNQWLVYNHHYCRGDICCCVFLRWITKFKVIFLPNQTSYKHYILGSYKARSAECNYYNGTTARNLSWLVLCIPKEAQTFPHDNFFGIWICYCK